MQPSLSLEKSKIKILLLEGVDPSAVDALNKAGYTNVEYQKKALDGQELLDAIENVHFIGIRSRTHLTAEVLQHAKKLIGIGCYCIGTNQVDLEAAAALGIPVFNAPFSNTRSVAELVTGEYLQLLRDIPARNALLHRGGWNKAANGCHEARGKTIGIIGYGHIGTQVGILAEALGLSVLFYDVENKMVLGNAKQVNTLDELLENSDIVTLHVPELPTTKNMISKAQFAKMKDGVRFLNASRGTVVDIEALCEALRSGKVAGAAVDVYPKEPSKNGEEFVTPLREFDNVILTPHIGAGTEEAQKNIGTEVSEKLALYSDNGSTLTAVNFPEVSLPTKRADVSRLLHVHKNVPGVMRQINETFAKLNINVAAQYLQTTADIGYVVMDIHSDKPQEVVPSLRNIEGTLKCRILY
ncbi:MAG: phosphoglycerate dehydrogenase [Succinivibrio dextrinosolvens]|uniref:D-3-phosphoglycerate dehydrogenase n=1 Tax=Succinivibrio dextrinosolvens TaxID=83771 RepID=A0A662Z7Q5_9GAMM|nr:MULTISPECIES: phosphoglycerate dehydrogenase [Succinivibrio]MBQ3883987.1 phosphoglycerate dehydrogenase [Succinivibrio sp.]MBQ9219700.1 phosphoglycerate dehydrogenase [Succinivibrio sp.]MDY6466762.1 phosphoglycerate dehydrogenase [Succinivibrio dextrinosolvens]MDY6469809.1 phosphoglycerate dehydrogenase [Succinivibrio dextrinosolvens]SFJ94524.1 D-3-phosphoglycerate dehydrogenase [Succinivibrio dextrinosolvens]